MPESLPWLQNGWNPLFGAMQSTENLGESAPPSSGNGAPSSEPLLTDSAGNGSGSAPGERPLTDTPGNVSASSPGELSPTDNADGNSASSASEPPTADSASNNPGNSSGELPPMGSSANSSSANLQTEPAMPNAGTYDAGRSPGNMPSSAVAGGNASDQPSADGRTTAISVSDQLNSMLQTAKGTGSEMLDRAKPVVAESAKEFLKDNWKEFVFGDGPPITDSRTYRQNDKSTLGPIRSRADLKYQMWVYAIQPKDPPPRPPEPSFGSKVEQKLQDRGIEELKQAGANGLGRACNDYFGNGNAQTRGACQQVVDNELSTIEKLSDGVRGRIEQVKDTWQKVRNLPKTIREDIWGDWVEKLRQF